VCSVDEDVAPPPPSADGKQGGCVTFDDEVTMEDTWWAVGVACVLLYVCVRACVRACVRVLVKHQPL